MITKINCRMMKNNYFFLLSENDCDLICKTPLCLNKLYIKSNECKPF